MLAYAFQVLRQTNYERIETEPFENAQDLFASIIHIGVSQQLKRGLYKEYIPKTEELKVLRGKLNITNTIRIRAKNDRQSLSCEHDDLSINNRFNQILKATSVSLSKNKYVKKETRLQLRNITRLFNEVDDINLKNVKWEQLRFRRNNKSYEMLLNICYFAYTESLLSNNLGNKKVIAFSDDNMAKAYEKFILEYYHRHHNYLKPGAYRINWDIDGDKDEQEKVVKYLPSMLSDITLSYAGYTLIIDAKYYTREMQEQFGKFSIRNANLYQVYTYVKNTDTSRSGKVSGMLLYAKTDSIIAPNADFSTGGNRITVRTLDLNRDFKDIKTQLDGIVDEFFPMIKDKQGIIAA